MLLILSVTRTQIYSTLNSERIDIPSLKLDINHKQNDFNEFLVKPELEDLILRTIEFGSIPSLTAAIIHKDRVIWASGFGEQSSLDTVFMIASITKTFTATAVLQLYEQGLIDLDADVNDYLPFPLRNPKYPDKSITTRMLLSHKSSLGGSQESYYDVTFQDLWRKLGFFNETYVFPSYPNWIKEYFHPNGSLYTPSVWNGYPPGPAGIATYANVGFDILGLIIERITSKPLEVYLNEEIFSPLGITNTGFNRTQFDQEKIVIPYFWNDTLDEVEPLPKYDCYAYGAGALRTTVMDLSNYLIAHMNGGISTTGFKILESNTIDLMHDCTHSSLGAGYGYGWARDSITSEWTGHNGGTVGTRAQMLFTYPEEEPDFPVGVIVIGNQGVVSESAIRMILNELMNDALTFSLPSEPININVNVEDNDKIVINWNKPLNQGNDLIKSYQIFRGRNSIEMTQIASIPGNETKYVDLMTNPNIEYYYSVSSVNGVGEGNKSIPSGPFKINLQKTTSSFTIVDLFLAFLVVNFITLRQKTTKQKQ